MKPILLFFHLLLTLHILTAQENMVLIPGCEFIMGKTTDRPSDYSPAHKVRIDSFYIDRYEVTNMEYYKFCMETAYPLPEFWGIQEFRCGLDFPDYPVVWVNLWDALKFAEWCGKRIPTEAEWECAARGGLVDNSFPNSNSIDTVSANFRSAYGGLLSVGKFAPNNYGIYDMAGNAWEWTTDRYSADYYQNSTVDNPSGPESSKLFVLRGGSWYSGSNQLQVFFRNALLSNWIDFSVGFRCARELNYLAPALP